MRYHISSCIICLVMIGVFSSSVNAQQIITPFGDIKWEDNIVDVIKKINAIQGIKNAEVAINDRGSYINNSTSILTLMKESDILDKISENAVPFLEYPYPNDVTWRTRDRIFNDNDGDNLVLGYAQNHVGAIRVKAEPILINNIPFSIAAIFEGNLGLMVKDKKTLLKVKIFDNIYYLPYYLKSVTLTPIGENRDKTMLYKIEGKIYEKYKGFLSNQCKQYHKQMNKRMCNNDFWDTNGKHHLIFSEGRSVAPFFSEYELGTITYEDNFMEKELANIYERYLISSEKNSNKEKYKESKDAAGNL